MGLASRLDIPNKQKEKRVWSFKQVFPLAALAGKFVKTFQNPMEILLAAVIVAAIVCEIFGKRIGIPFSLIILSLIAECSYERIFIKTKTETTVDSKPQEKV